MLPLTGFYLFCLGEEVNPKKIFEPGSGEKNFFRPFRGSGGGMPVISLHYWLKSHFWVLVIFTDSLKSSSSQISSWNSFLIFFWGKLFWGELRRLGGGSFPSIDRALFKVVPLGFYHSIFIKRFCLQTKILELSWLKLEKYQFEFIVKLHWQNSGYWFLSGFLWVCTRVTLV